MKTRLSPGFRSELLPLPSRSHIVLHTEAKKAHTVLGKVRNFSTAPCTFSLSHNACDGGGGEPWRNKAGW